MDTKEAIDGVGAILTGFLKSGPSSPAHLEEIKSKVFEIALPLVTSPEGYDWCIENYRQQSKLYFDERLSQFHDLLINFLKQVPNGGTKDKLAKSMIAEIKRELRSLTKWPRLFYTLKASSLVVKREQNGDIAGMWRSHWRRAGYDYRPEHKERDGKVYAIRGSWAMQQGLINKGAGYTDEMTAPGEELGCSCYMVYFTSPSELPESMLTAKGREWIKAKDDARRAKNS